MTMKFKLILLSGLFSITSLTFGQQSSTWDNWKWLTGEWIGEGNGKPGQGGGTFSFKLDLDQKVLVRKAHSEYAASGNKPKIVHDDLMIIYPDHSGVASKAIYFDNEGHTINYSITYADKSIIFTSDRIAGVPVFRLTYLLLENQTIDVKFEMSQDGVKFMTYVEGKSKRTN